MQHCIAACAHCARALIAVAVLVCGTSAVAAPLALEEAWALAEKANPAYRAAQAETASVEGRLAESRAPLFNNPTASFESWRGRTPQAVAPADRESDWRAGLSQTFEIAGQQGRRREAAGYDADAVRANIADARLRLRAEVEERFVQVLALQQRASLERETVAVVERAAQVVGKRREAGEASRLDANLARVEAERAASTLNQLGEQLTQARAQLAAVLQLPPAELPEVAGELRRGESYTLEQLLEGSARRPALESLARREEAARSRLDLERAGRYPDVTLGVFAGREGPTDLRQDIVGLSVSVPLPLFRRNEAAIGRAATELTQAQLQRQAAERDTAAAVRAQWQRLGQLESRADRLRQSVLPALEENLRLSQTSLREGEIGIAEVLLVNRQVAEARREALEAEAELRRARIDLERSAGWTAGTMGKGK